MTHGDDLERLKAAAPEAAELLRQLANANRLLILCHIAQQERSVGQLEQELGLRQPGLSQQLAELRQSGLVKTRRESRSIYYSLADERAEAVLAMLRRSQGPDRGRASGSGAGPGASPRRRRPFRPDHPAALNGRTASCDKSAIEADTDYH